MFRHRFRVALLASLAALLGHMPAASSAEPYPERPVHAVVPYPPGGVNDILVRLMAPGLSKALGQPVIIDNRPGANGIIGNNYVAKSAPDGYTLLFSGTPLAINASLYPSLPYDTLHAFRAVSMILKGTFVMVVNPSVPVHTPKEFIALAKREPGKLNFCSSGTGSPAHLMGELLNQSAGINIVHIPYRGAGPCLNDLIGGKVQAAFEGLAPLSPHIHSGKLRALAVMSEARSAALPDIPTMAEATGLRNLTADAWYGVFVAAGTPDAVVNRLHAAIGAALADPALKKKLADLGLDTATSTPEQLAQRLDADVAKWGKVIRAASVSVNP